MKKAEKFGAVLNDLLTEEVQSFHGPDSKRSYITNQQTVGQPLVTSKRLKTVYKNYMMQVYLVMKPDKIFI